MLFNEIAYLIFLPLVAAVYYLLPHPARWAHLLVASYFFYAWRNPLYAVLMLASTLVAWSAGRALQSASRPAARRALLGGALGVIFGPLDLGRQLGILGVSARYVLSGAAFIGALMALEALWSSDPPERAIRRWPWAYRWVLYLGSGPAILAFGVAEEIPFVYFQF